MECLSESIVELVDHMGGDKSVVNSARVSFAAKHDVVKYLDKGEPELIRFLMKNKHGTPFESIVMTFRIKTPIFVAREWFRHRIGSFNEMSARYKEMPMEFFVPEQARSQEGKPGAYSFTDMEVAATAVLHDKLNRCYEDAESAYKQLLADGFAKEQARLVLPVGIMTQFYWTVNARALMNFLELRLSPHAMLEIRTAAGLVDSHFKYVAPVTAKAFDDSGKAP